MPNSSDNSALAKALRIIRLISSTTEPLTITEIAKKIKCSTTTAHRILNQLVDYQVLQKINKRHFVISSNFYDTALDILSNSEITEEVHFILGELAQQVQETCNLSRYERGRVIYCDRVEYNWPHRITIPIGSKLPLHCTASGKLFLAFLDKKYEKIELFDLVPYTKNTMTSSQNLKENLKEIHRNKFALDGEEFMDGMDAIAVPVFIQNKKVPLFSLSIHAPITRNNCKTLLTYLPNLQHSASRLSDIFNRVASK